MFSKLAVRNVRRSFRDYGVYLLTLTFGVCLFYTFNSLDGQAAMVYLAQNGNPAVETILVLMDVLSVFVAAVLACLILYADRFLLRRRKRELGTYLLLGLSHGQVARVLFLETGAVGLLSLGAGLLLGVLASFGLSALTLSMFQMDMSQMLALTFSPRAAGKTAVYFGLIFLLVMLFSGLQVSRSKLIDLLRGDRKNEELRPRPLGVSVLQFAAGVVCLGAAYAILLTFGMAISVAVPVLCVPMLGLGTLGTLLIFRSLPGFVMRFVQRRPGLYFKGLNLFTLRQWLSRVHTTYLAQTVVCILLLLAVGITASAVGLNSTVESAAGGQAPYDLTVYNGAPEEDPADLDQLLRDQMVDPAQVFAWEYEAVVYYNDPAVTGEEAAWAALPLSVYNALLDRLGRPAYEGPLPYVPENWSADPAFGYMGNFLVVDDGTAGALEPCWQIWFLDYAGDKEAAEGQVLGALNGPDTEFPYGYTSRLETWQTLMGNKILVLFLGLYLGFTFLLAAAAVLALQQLSQGADNAGRYAVLRRLGAEEKLTARSAGQQVALAFLAPLALALIHSAVGMKAANDLIATAGKVDSAQSSAAAALVLLLVYGGYFLATALACRRMARGR